MRRSRAFAAAAVAGLLLGFAPGLPSSPAAEDSWGTATVEKTAAGVRVQLENSRIRVTYGRAADGRDKLIEFILKGTGKSVGQFDDGGGRLTDATVLDYGESKKVVRLDFGGRTQEVAIFRGSPVLEVDYPSLPKNGTTLDEGDAPGQPFQIDHEGWTIAGVQTPSGGYGVLLPKERIQSLKAGRRSGGFERVMSGAYTAYYFPAAEAGILEQGRELALRMTARRSKTVPFSYTRLPHPKAYTQIGDIDRDGRNDIVLRASDRVTWLHFPDYETHLIRTGPFGGDRFALADIDRDGDLDVITSQRSDEDKNFVYWYENPLPRGKATDPWREHRIAFHGDYVKDLKTGDLNRDGRPDIVVRSHHYTVIYFQKPAGEWLAKRIGHPDKEGMDLADLDGDGDLDVVLNGFWLETPTQPETGEFRSHTIDDKWFTQRTGSWRDNNAEVVVADINHDGLPDVVLAHSEQVGYPISWYSVESFAQARTGPWVEHRVAARFDWCQTLEVGDVDRDGNLDIVAAQFERDPKSRDTNSPPYPITVYYNTRGDGSRWSAEQIGSVGLYSGALGDVGSDGSLDLVGPHSYYGGALELWQSKPAKLALDRWTYIRADDSRARYDGKTKGGGGWFGLAAGDLTGDGYQDIVSGKWFYRNPGGDMTGKWERVPFGGVVDAVLITDVNGNGLGDVIALKCSEQYWFEATGRRGDSWRARKIGSLPVCNHDTGAQGYLLAQIVPGGKPEILLTGKGIHYLRIPDDPSAGPWPAVTIAPPEHSNGEMAGTADIDGDGDLDVVAAHQIAPGQTASRVAWFENPGDGSGNWKIHLFGETPFQADRISAVDLNGDGRPDVAVTEERYPGLEPDASLFWFEHPVDPRQPDWTRHKLITQFSMNNLDAADIDRDGDIDLVTCEHKGTNQKLQIWENDGRGKFTPQTIDRGKESHLGARLFDLDGDGDLDVVSIGWDVFQFLHIWRNDAIRKDH